MLAFQGLATPDHTRLRQISPDQSKSAPISTSHPINPDYMENYNFVTKTIHLAFILLELEHTLLISTKMPTTLLFKTTRSSILTMLKSIQITVFDARRALQKEQTVIFQKVRHLKF